MKIVYEDERKCNIDNIAKSKVPELRRLHINNQSTVLEALSPTIPYMSEQARLERTQEVKRATSPLNKSKQDGFREEYRNYICLLSKRPVNSLIQQRKPSRIIMK